ncbi:MULTISPECIES: hypothetical protein [Caballeronia]|uniref:Lipoprotein n=1 Tax=Caballeronia jiangsuensis TaxID=1458357 RepID=A0ABW9CDM3_9BURK|nr:hypothetical protein [Caballeronia sp. GaOx3]KAK48250.1 hypothetical protein BG58_33545 [Caballeronia jiangsuensis]
MKKSRNRAQRRALQIALIAGAAGMCFATAASADSQAAKKMGQMGVINQTLQPKPLKPPPATTNTPNAATTNPNYNANSTYNPNAANAANGVNPGATAAGAGQKK